MVKSWDGKYGDVKSLADQAPVAIAPVLSPDLMRDLFHHKICAIRVPNFFSADRCKILAEALVSGGNVKNWEVSGGSGPLQKSDVDTVGTPFNVAYKEGDDGVARYFREAVPRMQKLRELTGLSPMDKLRLELDELWPNGAQVKKSLQGQAYMAGLGRIMYATERHRPGFCHVDEINVMREDSGIFSANVYLKVPPGGSGGELDIWPIRIRNRWDFYRNASVLSLLLSQDPEGQRILRAALPPAITITPEPVLVKSREIRLLHSLRVLGELVLLSVQRPHAARGFIKGQRISMQTFITYEKGKPLLLES